MQALQSAWEMGHAMAIEAGGRFVQHQQFRAHGQHSGNGDPFFWPKLRVWVARVANEVIRNASKASWTRSRASRFAQPQIQGAEGHILFDRGGKQLIIWFLQYQADPPPPLIKPLAVVTHGLTVEQHRSIGGPQGAVEMQQQGGLAGTVAAQQRQLTTAFDGQIETTQGKKLIRIAVFQPLKAKRGSLMTRRVPESSRSDPTIQPK